MVIGMVSVFALRGYLVDGVDQQLAVAAHNADAQLAGGFRGTLMLPVSFVRETSVSGVGDEPKYVEGLTPGDLPPVVSGVDAVTARIGRPYTVDSLNHRVHWRVLIVILGNGSVLQ